MKLTIRPLLAFGLVVLIAAVFATDAVAFYPIGGISTSRNEVVIPRWPFRTMDVDGDGDVEPEGEGVEVHIATGFAGDFDAAEQQVIIESFQVWEDIPISYMSFYFGQPITDVPFMADVAIDHYNVVGIDKFDDLPDGVLGVTYMIMTMDDEVFQDENGNSYTITGGQFVESDILINGPPHRPSLVDGLLVPPSIDLRSTMVHEIGHFFGLGHPPDHDFSFARAVGDGDAAVGIELPSMWVRDPLGELVQVGATPTMFPIAFFTGILPPGASDISEIDLFDGGLDLAPDDIAGAAFLYPRGSGVDDFSISHFARSHTVAGRTSIPALGAQITVYVESDDDPFTTRIPVYSTMTGLFEAQEYLYGRFFLHNLPKTIENEFGGLLQASYTLSGHRITGNDVAVGFLNPLTGEIENRYFDDPDDWNAERFDSTHDGGLNYTDILYGEVFKEGGNVLGRENFDFGTPLVYDPIRAKVISEDTGNALDKMLPGEFPMFGDPTGTCPLNMSFAGMASSKTPTALRGFRDRVLVKSALGAAITDAYYSVAPTMARYLSAHESVLAGARKAAAVIEWSIINRYALLLFAIAGALSLKLRKQRVMSRAVLGLVLIAGLVVAAPAQALLLRMELTDLTKSSDNVIVGKVTDVQSRWNEQGNRIVTDVTIKVQDTAKGRMNKDALVHIRLLGGRVGGLVAKAPGMPTFSVDEEVVLFLQKKGGPKNLVVGGTQGKRLIQTDPKTGEKSMAGLRFLPKVKAKNGAAKQNEKFIAPIVDNEETKKLRKDAKPVSLDAFVDYIRDTVKQQKK